MFVYWWLHYLWTPDASAFHQSHGSRRVKLHYRSETTDLIVEISLQPWKSFQPDGVILFRWGLLEQPEQSDSILATKPAILDMDLCCSDILTPLPALGVPFEIDDVKGPLIANPVRSMEQVSIAISVHASCCNATCTPPFLNGRSPLRRCINLNQ